MQHHVPEEWIPQLHPHENLKSCKTAVHNTLTPDAGRKDTEMTTRCNNQRKPKLPFSPLGTDFLAQHIHLFPYPENYP